MKTVLLLAFAFLSFAASGASGLVAASAPASLPADVAARVDDAAQHVITQTGLPGASIAIVEHGQVVYTRAYGKARLEPPTAAEPGMRYAVGSISKQFTAAAVLLLEQQGKLSIEDPVSKYMPELTRSGEVTIRMLLSHTSGYQDYWPEDYLMPSMRQPTTAQYILDTWGKKPLDFDPGTRWQYSNTNYVIAGRIVEQVSHTPLMQFLQQNIFGPLRMNTVYDLDAARLGDTDVEGYIRYALGPLRAAPREGQGWMFAAGELAMPAGELALWDISLMHQSLLNPASYREMFTSVKLKDGTDSHYGLGLFTMERSGHKAYEHSGEVSGFVSENIVFPEDEAAIAVLTNQDASPGATLIAQALTPIVLGTPENTAKQAETEARQLFTRFQLGKIDRSRFTENCNAYFSQQALKDFATSLSPLGEPVSFRQVSEQLRGGMTFRAFRASFRDGRQVTITTYSMPDGRLEQYLVEPVL